MGGTNLRVPNKCIVMTGGQFEVELGENITLHNNVKLSVWGTGEEIAKLKIRNGVSVGDRTEIHAGYDVCIGDETLIAWDCCIMDHDYHKFNDSVEKKRPVTIGKHVWIVCNVIILKGGTIGDGAVIAAGSVVTHDVPPNCLAVENPAKVIRQNISWKG